MRTKMLSKLLPYRIFDKFDDISPEYLSSLGVRFLFSDVDNTLAPYEVPEPDDRIRSWLDLSTVGLAGLYLLFPFAVHTRG